MSAGRPQPPVIYQGDSFEWIFRMTDEDEAGVRAAVDLTGVMVLSQVRSTAGGDVVTTFTSAVAADQAVSKGVVILSLTPAQTAALTASGLTPVEAAQDLFLLGAWDVQLLWPSGKVETPIRGSVHFQLDVSR